MKFYDRNAELQILEKNWQQSVNHSVMTTLIGRRRIGKTALLLKSAENNVTYAALKPLFENRDEYWKFHLRHAVTCKIRVTRLCKIKSPILVTLLLWL